MTTTLGFGPARKAWIAGALAAVATGVQGYVSSTPQDQMSLEDMGAVALAGAAGYILTWLVPNRPTPPATSTGWRP